MASHNSALFREIHKNAWLRKLPTSDRKSGANLKKGDKVWTVFCVHDDTEPYLELYNDQKMAAAHRPEMTISLASTLHVSPTICPQDDEFEFVITLPSDLIRLTAPNWEGMIDWVDTLSSKLREMHLLSPKENIYSRNPESRPPLLPTRDPNSPLPLPPPGSSFHMLGVEVGSTSETITPSGSSSRERNPTQNEQLSDPVSTFGITTSASSELLGTRNTGQSSGELIDCVESNDNITVIEVSSEPGISTAGSNIFDFSFMGTSLEQEEEFYTPPVTPVLPRASIQRRRNNSTSSSSEASRVTVIPTSSSQSVSQLPDMSEPRVPESERPVDTLYEHVFLANTPIVSPFRHQIPREVDPWERNHLRSSESGSTTSHPEETERRRVNERSMQDRRDGPRNPPLQPPPQPFTRGFSLDVTHRLTLREQQVLQLRKEMMHSGGVRLQLRRKDCVGSIALVDAFSAVWVAGWKQKDHPMLYNALHIGDQLMSVAGILVQNANDAQRLIRGAPSLYVELIIRRVPCGRVYALRRESEGQDLGIIQEGKTAEIREITAGSIAALGGLSSRAPTLDGLSLTSCVLTEINGRPLNLFFKDNEVRDRLNAVGLDISLLIQPLDLIRQIKKQLKSMRNYKDYIVQ